MSLGSAAATAVCLWLALAASVHAASAPASQFCQEYVREPSAEERLAQSTSFSYADGALEWASSVGGPDADIGWDIAYSNKTVFFAGYFEGRTTFGNPDVQAVTTIVSRGLQDGYVTATDHDDGYLQWVATMRGPFDDSIQGVAVTPDHSGVIAVGYFSEYGSVQGALGTTVPLVAADVTVDGFIARFNATSGRLEWAFAVGGGLYDVVWGVTAAPSAAIVYGYYSSNDLRFRTQYNGTEGNSTQYPTYSNGGYLTLDLYLAAVSYADGNVSWVETAGGTLSDAVFDAEVVDDGDMVVIGGYVEGTAWFGATDESNGTRVDSHGVLDAFVATYHVSNGSLVAVKVFGGEDDDVVLGVTVAPNNTVVVAGWFESETIDVGNWSLVNRGSMDSMLGYMAAPGFGFGGVEGQDMHERDVHWFLSPMWGRSQQSLTAVSLNARKDRALVGGFFRGVTTFLHDNGTVIEESMGDASTDTVLGSLRLSDGTFEWRTTAGGPLNDQIEAVEASPVRLFFTGLQRSTAVYGGNRGWERETTLVSVGGVDAVIGSIGDVAPPLVRIDTNAVLVNDTVPVQVAFSEVSVGLTLADMNVTGGFAANLSAVVEGLEYTFDVVNMTDGPVTVGLFPGAIADPTGNVNVVPPTPFTMTYDGTPPNVSLYSPLWDPTSADTIPITATFSECVSFELLDVSLSSGFACGLQPLTACRRNEPYVVLFRVLGMDGGNFTANITAGAVQDVAGNGNVVVPTYSIVVDKSRPTVELTSVTRSPTNGNISITATFDVRVTGFGLDDVEFTSGVIVDLQQPEPQVFTFILMHPDQGVTYIQIPPEAAFNDAGNPNIRSQELVSPVYDTVRPRVVLTSDAPFVTNQPVPVTITFSEPIVSFDRLSPFLHVSSGTLAPFHNLNDTIFTSIVTDSVDGPFTVDVDAHAVYDPAGNPSFAATTLQDIKVDRTRPIATVTSPNPRPTNSTIELVVSFDEYVEGLTLAMVNASSGDPLRLQLVTQSHDGTTWQLQLMGMDDGLVTVNLGEVLADPALNWNVPAEELAIVFDSTPPMPRVWSETVSPTRENAVMEVEFSEFVQGFDLGDIDVLSGYPDHLVELVPGRRYSFQIVDADDGYANVQVVPRSSQDPAGNGNVASNAFVGVVTDRTNATVTFHSEMSGPTNQNIVVTAVFDETVSGLTTDDFRLSSGVATELRPVAPPLACPVPHVWETATSWEFTIVGADDGFPQVWLPGAAVVDVAGNPNSPASQWWTGVEYDTTSPTAVLTTSLSGKTLGESSLVVTVTFSELVQGLQVDSIVLSSGWVSALVDVTPAHFVEVQRVLFSACDDVAGVYPRNATGALVEGHTMGFSTYEFVVNDMDNDRLTVDILAGAARDAGGNPTLAPPTYTVYKWPGWFTTVGVAQGVAATGVHIAALVVLLACWQLRYMRLRFQGRVSLESTLEEHEEKAAAEAKEALRLDKLKAMEEREAKKAKAARKKARARRRARRRKRRERMAMGIFDPSDDDSSVDDHGDSSGSDDSQGRAERQAERRAFAAKARQARLMKRREDTRRVLSRIPTIKCLHCGKEVRLPKDFIKLPTRLAFYGSDDEEGDSKEAFNADMISAEALHAAHAAGANPEGILSRAKSKQRVQARARERFRDLSWRTALTPEQLAEREAKLKEAVVGALANTMSRAQLGGEPAAVVTSAGPTPGGGGGMSAAATTATAMAAAGNGASNTTTEVEVPKVSVPRRLRPMVRTVSGWKGKKPLLAATAFNRSVRSLLPSPAPAEEKPADPTPTPTPATETAESTQPSEEQRAAEAKAKAAAAAAAREQRRKRAAERRKRRGGRRKAPAAASPQV